MFKTVGAVIALAVTTLTAVPAGHANSYDPNAAVSARPAQDLGVPSRPQAAPTRIISGSAAEDTMKLAYCYYRYVTDVWGNIYLQTFCD